MSTTMEKRASRSYGHGHSLSMGASAGVGGYIDAFENTQSRTFLKWCVGEFGAEQTTKRRLPPLTGLHRRAHTCCICIGPSLKAKHSPRDGKHRTHARPRSGPV